MSDNLRKSHNKDFHTYQIKLDSITYSRLKANASQHEQEFSTHLREVLRFHIDSLGHDDGGEAARVGMAMTKIYRAINTLSALDASDPKMPPLVRLVMALRYLVDDAHDKDIPHKSIETLYALAAIDENRVETVAAVADVLSGKNDLPRRRGRPRKYPLPVAPEMTDAA
jgi:hypothetical protein